MGAVNIAEIKTAQLLLVEDDPDISTLVQLHLQDEHAHVVHCANGIEALQQAQQRNWDLIILDLQLPGIGGLEICRRLRDSGDQTPILMLTARISELDRVLGLELGADDYVSKPFSPIELMARIRAILRRASILQQAVANNAEEILRCGGLTINVEKHCVLAHGQVLDLTSKEFDLLLHFAHHPRQVFRRSELLDKVWGYGHEGYEHTVNSHINRLRSKIEDNPAQPNYIITVWGVGYKFDSPVIRTVT